MIEFDHVSKTYSGSSEPAVRDLSLFVEEGEICILVGPSGCGKTTSLKMTNRVIEPSSGTISVAGQSVLDQNPVQLRRNIGYVIQQIGLFPHQTIGDNIATVPKLLGWDRGRIHDRVDELLHLVGLESEEFRDRYPRELSGGQRQRIGVARALAADPPVMLMDEPFGAVDPITRDRLQNEFLRLQEELGKTIMFVTHDIDEAIKMGDRIAILNVGGVLEQYDKPETLLDEPHNDFVSDFVGADRAMKRLSLFKMRDLDLIEVQRFEVPGPGINMKAVLLRPSTTGRDALALIEASRLDSAVVVDDDGRPTGWVTLRAARSRPDAPVSEFANSVDVMVEEQSTIKDVLSEMLAADSAAIVLDRHDAVAGVVTMDQIQASIAGLGG
ncbi:MAG: ABC transporter ATP-binding protein [Acidimicrobiia bacterium]|nr:ABC transporter ATP-binding protein [Acidimicrobiia bacterium]